MLKLSTLKVIIIYDGNIAKYFMQFNWLEKKEKVLISSPHRRMMAGTSHEYFFQKKKEV